MHLRFSSTFTLEDHTPLGALDREFVNEERNLASFRTFIPADQEPEICVVCQCEYEDEETIGTLECRHEYHADCIKRWLMKKNVCPPCTREGIQQKS
ncbi:unnamed protein product [Coffea canephora]|uniref:RING-type E3 ubiquitin transferase n=1 Tax=Coffea canephora TaxID=49390 RepID=A0A068U8A3_COFCA|nr:unnamed protein product [Coffea canephora]